MIGTAEPPAIAPSPKRKHARKSGSYDVYPYYAAYDQGFAVSALRQLTNSQVGTVLDPWNGSGTTTVTAATMGLHTIGLDLNPAMKIVARGRLAPSMIEQLTHLPSAPEAGIDPLDQWFTSRAVAAIRRAVSWAMGGPAIIESTAALDALSSDQCLRLTLIFRAARKLVRRVTSNPTWTVANPDQRGSFGDVTLLDAVNIEIEKSLARPIFTGDSHLVSLLTADSRQLPIKGESIAHILTSPPYCTRIDYAVATRVELAIMGPLFSSASVERTMRDRMLGTTTISRRNGVLGRESVSESWGPTCETFLTTLYNHNSYASKSYYYPNHFQYFDALAASMSEIARVLSPGGTGAIVVQDSWYKDVRNDLAQIVDEMLYSAGLSITSINHFSARAGLATVHPHTGTSSGRHPRIESVLYFTKPSQ